MDLKKKVLDVKRKFLEEKPDQEFPEKFDLSKKAEKNINEAGDIEAFLHKKKEEKGDKQENTEETEEIEELEEEKPVESTNKPTPESNWSNLLTLYIDNKNVEISKKPIDLVIQKGFVVGLQAGIVINKENFVKVKDMLNFLTKNGFSVVVSAEKIDPVFK